MDTRSNISRILSVATAGLLITAAIVNVENIKVLKQISENITVNNQTTASSEVEVTGDGNTVNNSTTNSNTTEPKIVMGELPDVQHGTTEVIYTIYTNYYTLSDETLKEVHPYIKDYDLVEYGCPVCGYQLYCFDSAGSAAVACLRCTNCDWESKEVHIEHCTEGSEAKKILLDLFKKGELTKDVEFQYASDYKWY